MDALTEILRSIPQNVVAGILLNGTVMTLAYLIVWKLLKERLATWRIQLKQRADGEQIKRELKNAMLTFLIGASFSSIVIYLSKHGLTKIYTDYADHPFFSIFGFFILLVIDDTWFYWCHRLLHHPKIYRHIHLEHHKSIDVDPFTSASFHGAEALLLTLWILPVALWMPIYAPVLGLIQIWGLLDNLKSHLGYEFYPKWWNKSWFRFLTSSTHHNMHHSKFHGNYGVHFRFWDKLMGTEFKSYEEEFNTIQQRKHNHKNNV
jgi:Delta7-sterol 5-desaturase